MRAFEDLLSWQLLNMQHSVINDSHHAAPYIPRTYLFHNWNLVLFDPLHPLHLPPPLVALSVLCICELGFVYF